MNKNKVEDYLIKGWGFKKKHADKDSYWLEKKMPHPFIKGLQVVYDDIYLGGSLMIYAKRIDTNELIILYECKYTKAKLIKIMVMLSFNDDIETIMHQSLHYE